MATYDPNNAGGYFRSAMQELGAYDQDDEMEDEFIDAPEHQPQYDGNMEDFDTDFLNNTAGIATNNGDSSSYLASAQRSLLPEEKAPEYDHVPTQKAEQGYTPFTFNRPGHYNPYDESEGHTKVDNTGASERYTAAYHSAIKRTSDTSQDQHVSGCSGTRGASTPPATPPPEPTQSSKTEVKSELKSEPKFEQKLDPKVWLGPDDLRDVAKPIFREKRWHDKVAHLHPRVPLASHRYWIGVLNPGMKSRSACKEEHFTWMKGNRFTTVETVSRVYAATTMHEGVFIMGGERPEITDRMEELDLFNDKVVLFQVVEEGTPAAVGRLLTEGLVTKEIEVVELDD